jgi:hypothetical protein
MSEQLVSGVVMPTDRTKAWNLDYNVEVPDEDDEPGHSLLFNYFLYISTKGMGGVAQNRI